MCVWVCVCVHMHVCLYVCVLLTSTSHLVMPRLATRAAKILWKGLQALVPWGTWQPATHNIHQELTDRGNRQVTEFQMWAVEVVHN